MSSALTAGTRLGPYEIVATIGAGGMGEVLRAHDSKLGRDVAIKVLPAAFAQDAERVARFRREAQTLASLNHSNIAAIYGLEESDKTLALVLELVEGEDLAERLKRGALPVDEAIAIAKQMAEALEEAHEKGVVHRDLKPANVKVTADGKVKVLDFGLAKAFATEPMSNSGGHDLSQSPTLAGAGTMAGMILGTAAYMSPEQARGKPVDRRADIWSFGVVLFEMLSGQQLFKGETVSDTLAAVLRQEIPWERLPPGTPRAVVRALRRSLDRDPKRRLHSAADAQLELEEAAEPEPSNSPVSAPAPSSRVPWLLAGFLTLALAATWSRGLFVSQPAPAVARLKVELATGEPLATALGANAVLSPDGRSIAFVAESQGTSRLQVRGLDQLEATPLAGTNGARSPFFSPDGRWLGYATPTGLMKIGVAGGAPVKLVEVGADPGRGAAWSGNQIVFARINSGLFRLSDAGGEAVPLTTLDATRHERSHRWPSFVPGDEAVVFMVQHLGQDYDDADIEAVSLADGRRTVLVRGGAFPRVAAGGALLFVRDHVLYAVRFDTQRLRVEEPATPVVEGLLGYTGDEAQGDGSAEVSLSERGDLLYRAGGTGDSRAGADFLWLLAEAGVAVKEAPAFHEPIQVASFELSPAGDRVAIEGRSARGPGIFLKDLARGTLSPLSSDGAGETNPLWSPDGRRLAYTARSPSGLPTVKVRTLDGSAPEVELPAPVQGLGATSWTRDGRALVVEAFVPRTLNDIVLLPIDGGHPRPLRDSAAIERQGRLSPDGRLLAYQSDETGVIQVFVTALDPPGPRVQVSLRGGGSARWSRDGRVLYFVEASDPAQGGPLVAVPVTEQGGRFRVGEPRVVSAIPRGMVRASYDVHPDGRLLLVRRPRLDSAALDAAHAILVTGWRTELARLMSGNKR